MLEFTATANNFAITFAQANRVGRPRRGNGRVRTKIRKGKHSPNILNIPGPTFSQSGKKILCRLATVPERTVQY